MAMTHRRRCCAGRRLSSHRHGAVSCDRLCRCRRPLLPVERLGTRRRPRLPLRIGVRLHRPTIAFARRGRCYHRHLRRTSPVSPRLRAAAWPPRMLAALRHAVSPSVMTGSSTRSRLTWTAVRCMGVAQSTLTACVPLAAQLGRTGNYSELPQMYVVRASSTTMTAQTTPTDDGLLGGSGHCRRGVACVEPDIYSLTSGSYEGRSSCRRGAGVA